MSDEEKIAIALHWEAWELSRHSKNNDTPESWWNRKENTEKSKEIWRHKARIALDAIKE